jgi:flagellar FliL protein
MSDEAQAPTESTAKPKKGVLIGAIAGGAVAGLAAGAFALAPAIAPKPAAAAAPDTTHADTAHSAPTAPTVPPTVLTNLVVNPAGSRGSRFLLVSVGLEFTPAVPEPEFTAREPEIRDRILALLATKTVEFLVEPSNRDALRVELKAAVDSMVGAGRTTRVLFPQFVIQ